jgi:hypothetical protein
MSDPTPITKTLRGIPPWPVLRNTENEKCHGETRFDADRRRQEHEAAR